MTASLPNISKLTSRVIRVLGCNPGPMELQGTNTYLIGTGQRRILLDTGVPNKLEYISNLRTVLNDNDISLEHVIITHWHMDHIGGVPEVLKLALPECKVWKYPRSDVESEQGKSLTLSNYAEVIFKLYNNQVFETEGATLRVVHTPGHTTDHVVLVLKEENAVFSGDCILGEGTTVFEDLQSFIDSLKLIRSMRPTVIYPGHGPVVENTDEVINYYIEHRIQRENEIIELLKSSFNNALSIEEITRQLYKGYPENLIKAAQNLIGLHLKKLRNEGKVIEKEGRWKIYIKNNI